jgi:hypothetical protein
VGKRKTRRTGGDWHLRTFVDGGGGLTGVLEGDATGVANRRWPPEILATHRACP